MGEGSSPYGVAPESRFTFRAVTTAVAVVVGLTFLFGFGNVWTLALHLGVTPWVAPLVAPAVDLSVMGLLLGIRYLALQGAPKVQLRPARRLLILSGAMTLALNVAEPVHAGQWGRAVFDAVGPLLLIGWAEVGPGLLQAINDAGAKGTNTLAVPSEDSTHTNHPTSGHDGEVGIRYASDVPAALEDELLERAQRENALHWAEVGRPISAETLRKRLRIGAARSRTLVAAVRSAYHEQRSR